MRSEAPLPSVLLESRLSIWRLVGSSIQAAHELLHGDLEHLADAQQRRDGNRTASLDLLPMSRGEAARDHVLLGVSMLLAEVTDSYAQGAEEFVLIRHALGCRVLRADSPRAE